MDLSGQGHQNTLGALYQTAQVPGKFLYLQRREQPPPAPSPFSGNRHHPWPVWWLTHAEFLRVPGLRRGWDSGPQRARGPLRWYIPWLYWPVFSQESLVCRWFRFRLFHLTNTGLGMVSEVHWGFSSLMIPDSSSPVAAVGGICEWVCRQGRGEDEGLGFGDPRRKGIQRGRGPAFIAHDIVFTNYFFRCLASSVCQMTVSL